jgi:hypothetical protein
MQLELPKFLTTYVAEDNGEPYIAELDPYAPRSFHLYMLKYQQERMQAELMAKRGFTFGTIQRYLLGHTGEYWTIPVYDLEGGLYTIRYRADDEYTTPDTSKYGGLKGRNDTMLYPFSAIAGRRFIEQLWIVEGEYDSLAVNQALALDGARDRACVTATNGAESVRRIVELVRETGLDVGRWVIATDQDGPGECAAQDLLDQLAGQDAVRAYWHGGKDACEYLAAGGSLRDVA